MMKNIPIPGDLAGEGSFCGTGPDGDVVVSSRVRLARNLAGHLFTHQASHAERRGILDACRSPVLELLGPGCAGVRLFGDPVWIRMDSAAAEDKQLLLERHLISRGMARRDREFPRAVAAAADGSRSVMVNEEDHLRLQAVFKGLALEEAFAAADALDDSLSQKLELAFSRRFGFLTACPTNVGTGLRAGVMLHLPALAATCEIEKVKAVARDTGLALRGLYGEGTEPMGDLYQISNQTTLGRCEREILADFSQGIVPQVVRYEREARAALAKHRSLWLKDHVRRAWGALTHAHLMPTKEALSLLSQLRLGVQTGMLPDVSDARLARLMFLAQPAHLQKFLGKRLAAAERRQERAGLIRDALAKA